MHIVHFCGALKGGPLSAIAEWLRQQLAAGHKVSLIYSPLRDPVESFRNDLPQDVALIPLQVHREIDLGSDLAAVRQLVTWLNRIRPDVLHLHSSKAGAIGRIAALLAGVPAVYSTHGVAFLRTDVGPAARAFFYGMEFILGLIGTVTVACSPSELAAMRRIPGRKLTIPNGINLGELPDSRPKDKSAGMDIVLCGRITAQKNPELANRIAAASPAEWRWTWLGDGELRDAVLAGGRIAVAGWMPRGEVLARLGAADVMVHTSSWEGMPIAILEAMALGLPAVVTDVVGNRDLVVSGKTGFVADTDSDLLQALKQLETDPELRRRMGEAGHERIMKEFDQEKLGKIWLSLYSDIWAQRERPIATHPDQTKNGGTAPHQQREPKRKKQSGFRPG
ncbi:MAG TPA: glycosyltransferase [Rhizomicrobium sp.]|nr:glycosyltransferase [Rhizomicrobium sp.]